MMTTMIKATVEDVIDYARQLPLATRAELVKGIVETFVDDTALSRPQLEPPDPATHTPEQIAQIYALRREWAENARRREAGEFDDEFNQTSLFEGMNQEEALAYMKAEWEANKLARANDPIPPPQDTFTEAYGLLETGVPGPSDEEVKQLLHERRMRKYG